MLINGIDISNLHTRLIDRVISISEIDTKKAWNDGSIQPTFIRQEDKFKKIDLTFLILENDEDTATMTISTLAKMLHKATINFDDIDLSFDVILDGATRPTRLKNGNFKITFNLSSGYARGKREIYTTDATATTSFRLNVLYYQNGSILVGQEGYNIRAVSFDEGTPTLTSIGINVDKYRTQYYNAGVPTNLGRLELTYENLQALGTLIINYEPVQYSIEVNYFLDSGSGPSHSHTETFAFTYPQLQTIGSIGQLVKLNTYRPDGYRATVSYSNSLTVENLLEASPIRVDYALIENEQTKNITLIYRKENDNGEYEIIESGLLSVPETRIVEGTTLEDIFNFDAWQPNNRYYTEGQIEGHSRNEIITYADLEVSYYINYRKRGHIVYLEYYAGVYPGWYRMATIPITLKWQESYDIAFSFNSLDIDLDHYQTAEYQSGRLYNADNYGSFDDVINAGVIQIYYVPIDYNIKVRYKQDDSNNYTEETVSINAINFFASPLLSDIVDIAGHKPENYQFDPEQSYNGEITLSALTSASPIYIIYTEIQVARTKNIIIRYKQELASTFSTINTSLIAVSEDEVASGVRLRDLINLNAYRPEYYNPGILNGESENNVVSYENLNASYEVFYYASTYSTAIQYYTDEVDARNWVGASAIDYKIIDFTTETTLYDLGLNPNLFKTVFNADGVVQYNGLVNFSALRELTSINVVYDTIAEPDEPGEIDYPHRFLFLQHNDLDGYESEHPNWTMNHAYINSGVSCLDMSKLTVIMECERVDAYVPLHQVNAGYAYLFGSSSPLGQYYMRFNNQTQYGIDLSGVNTYEAKAGLYTDELVLTETNAIGWGANSGIYSASNFNGYSTATFTFTNRIQTEHAQMPNPLYLFAMNYNNTYAGGLAGIGIYSCKILYDGELIRDFIPVQYYDKIGSQIAPSNCLYDKITQTFFEDATGQNSFNIRDDERYEDTNLAHKIGSFYVNYYQGDLIFETKQIFYRGDEFEEVWDLNERLEIDAHQPAYYKSGTILNLADLEAIDFEHLNNFIFNVRYLAEENTITVYYYKDNDESENNLIATDRIVLKESDFYQVPTFGDIVRLNKYKPAGYQTDYEFPEPKTTLRRVMDHNPYTIIYTPIEGEEATFTTTIKYIKKVWGIRTYETIAEVVALLGASDFRDGEYIDYYIDFDAYKPAKYYNSGETYQWYRMDRRLSSPSALAEEYIIVYTPTVEQAPIRYYTDDIDERNLIATTTWSVSVDDFDGPFYVLDQLPNKYVNLFKPVGCDGGIIQNTGALITFEDLINNGIDIMYETRIEPGIDPFDPERIPQVLFYDLRYGANAINYIHNGGIQGVAPELFFNGATIPNIDLGYTPKEIGRVAIEAKAVAMPSGWFCDDSRGLMTLDNTYFVGYLGAIGTNLNPSASSIRNPYAYDLKQMTYNLGIPEIGAGASGCIGLRPHIPKVNFSTVYTNWGPATYDGQTFTNTYRDANGQNTLISVEINSGLSQHYSGMVGVYRKGMTEYEDDYDYTYNVANETYGREIKYDILNEVYNTMKINPNVYTEKNIPLPSGDNYGQSKLLCNPVLMKIDAYNSSIFSYDFGTDNDYLYDEFDESRSNDIWEARCRPLGSMTLFHTRNPDTGTINYCPQIIFGLPNVQGMLSSMVGVSFAERQRFLNPDDSIWQEGITYEDLVLTGLTDNGTPIYEIQTKTGAYPYAGQYLFPQNPINQACYIWSLKIWDQGKLVRDLVPVSQGEVIYDQVMPANGLFDLITEIFFTNSYEGGTFTVQNYDPHNGFRYTETITVPASDVAPLYTITDPNYWGQIPVNYYDDDNSYIGGQFVKIPTWYNSANTTLPQVLQYDDFKPNDFYLNGFLDTDDPDNPRDPQTLYDIYENGTAHIYYKLRNFSKSVVYYKDDLRIGSKDIFFNFADIQNAHTITDLPIDPQYYSTSDFKPGRIIFDNSLLESGDMAGFIDAPAPIVKYDKWSYADHPELVYVEYYRGGAYDDGLNIQLDVNNNNYFNCNLTAKVLNPVGAMKYQHHYHQAYYEDEPNEYFLAYQAKVIKPYVGIHYGPARKYKALAYIATKGTVITIEEERNGWGKIKEYYHGWILLSAVERIQGPGQNPDYDPTTYTDTIIPYNTTIAITKLTVDRLWAYVPAYDCWVKTEEISYDQSGKLYNAIALDVINLDEITANTWNSATALTDIGIDPQKKRLRYHNFATVEYDGPIDYEHISEQHEFDFVYPETLYHYNCHYHSYNLDGPRLGTVMFSCSISDWNPDWDYFIETSWQTDENENEIPPTLYRAAPISLTWDYFGFNRNLFRPSIAWNEGIYIWNPHPWNEETIFFTFEELVRTGTQYIFYPYFWTRKLKYNYGQGGSSSRCLTITPSNNGPYTNVVIDIEPPMNNSVGKFGYFQYNYTDNTQMPPYFSNSNTYTTLGYTNRNKATYENRATVLSDAGRLTFAAGYNTSYTITDDYYKNKKLYYEETDDTNSSSYQNVVRYLQCRKDLGYEDFFQNEPNGYYRCYGSATSPYSSRYIAKIPYNSNTEEKPKYLMEVNRDDTYIEGWMPIDENFYNIINNNSYTPYGITSNRSGVNSIQLAGGIYHGIKIYNDSMMMTNYFIPIGRGDRGIAFSEYDRRFAFNAIKQDGLVDILNTTSKENASIFCREDYDRTFYQNYRSTTLEDPYEHNYNGFDTGYLNNEGLPYDAHPVSQNTLYRVKDYKTVQTYHYPDTGGKKLNVIPSNVVIPVSHWADQTTITDYSSYETRWYSINNHWFDLEDKMVLATEQLSKLSSHECEMYIINYTTVLLKATENTGNANKYYTTKDLLTYTLTSWSSDNNGPNQLLKIIASWNDRTNNKVFYLTDDYRWIDMEATSAITELVQSEYAVSDAVVPYYSYPIADDEFKLGQYLAGDRVWVSYRTVRNTNWLQTQQGWVFLDNDNLLIVE